MPHPTLLNCVSAACQSRFYGTKPTGTVLLILPGVLLCPLLLGVLVLSNLVIASHHSYQSSPSRALAEISPFVRLRPIRRSNRGG
jgi:hypothetical protein